MTADLTDPAEELTCFVYDGHDVRVVTGDDGEPWFVLVDLCRVLGLTNPSEVARRLDADALSTAEVIDSMGRRQQARTVSEPGLYEVVFMSRRPGARAFRRWVTHEVLPRIRRTGAYRAPALSGPELMAAALVEAQRTLEAARSRAAELEERLEAEAPHARFGRLVSSCEGDLLVGQVAALITQGGLPVTPVRLFAWLRGHGWLCRGSDRMWNMPTKWALTRRYMRFAVTVVATGHGTRERTTPYVTGPGQQVLTDGFLTGRYTLTSTSKEILS